MHRLANKNHFSHYCIALQIIKLSADAKKEVAFACRFSLADPVQYHSNIFMEHNYIPCQKLLSVNFIALPCLPCRISMYLRYECVFTDM